MATAQESALKDCLSQKLDCDTLVFIDAGVMHLLSGMTDQLDPTDPGVYFSSEDLEARGLVPFAREQGVQIVDDRATVRLLRSHDHCLTWK